MLLNNLAPLRSSSEAWDVFAYFVICLLFCLVNIYCLICARYVLVPACGEFIFVVWETIKNVFNVSGGKC